MKVLVSPAQTFLSSSSGGEVSWAYNIMTRLAENYGVQIDAICGEATDLYLPSNVRLFEVGFSKMDLLDKGLFALRLYKLAKRFAKSVDLVHHMFPFGFKAGLNLLAVFKHLRDKPFIIGPIQYPQEYSDVGDYEWVTGRKGLEARLMYELERITTRFIQKPIEMFHIITLSEAEALVFDSRKTLELYRKLYPDILSKTLEVIPPGVEAEQFQYVPLIKKDHLEILTVGYLLKRKGIQYLIRVMPLILKEIKNVKLRIIGDGPYKPELVHLVNRLSLDDHVIFEKHVPRTKIHEYYSNCDVYAQPSLSETIPSTIREAMAVGRPVVATCVGIIEEYVKDGVNGYLIQPKDHEMLVRKIIDLLADEELRIKIGKEARRYAEETLSYDKVVREWYRVYKAMV